MAELLNVSQADVCKMERRSELRVAGLRAPDASQAFRRLVAAGRDGYPAGRSSPIGTRRPVDAAAGRRSLDISTPNRASRLSAS